MGNMEELIEHLCPEGVISAKLGEVCEIKTGKGITQKDCSDSGKYPVYSGGKEPMGYYKDCNRKGNTVTISRVGANAGFVNYVAEDFYLNDKCFSVIPKERNSVLPVFLYYKLKDIECNIIKLQSEGGVPTINTKKVSSLEIPLPPLAVQKKIVEILDTFTGMISNLQKELEQRQKQFEYYCENLVGSAKGEVKTLGEIGRMERGTGLLKSDFRDTGVPCIHYGQIHTYYNTVATETKSFCSEELAKKLRKAKPGDLLIATTSEDVEACCKATVWLGEGEVAYSGDSFKFSHNQNPKYIAYLFKTEAFSKQKRLCATGAKVVRVSGAAMEKFKFSFPSLDKQQEIVDKLDTFEALISNIKQEIELRQKQYEYYREKLLTFE